MGCYELTDRSRRLLAALVGEHIETGEPVSSQALARSSGLGVSSATIRNVLAQLEDAGYVHQPHTSAGRVPTDRGYRVFVDLLLESRKPTRPAALVESQLRQQASRSPLMDDLLASVSHLVSKAARHVGFALAGTSGAILQRIEFVPIGGNRVLVIVVAQGNQMTQKVVDAGEDVRTDELVQAANYLNTEFAGLPLLDVREAVLARLEQERTLYDQLLTRALRLARSTLEELPRQHTFHVEGAASLLASSPSQESISVATLRALLEMMEEKERMVHLLNQYIDGPGLTIVIGCEHVAPGLRPFSLIASTAVDGSTIRTVGVIGPTRMHYSRAITLVDGTTQAVTRVLRDSNQDQMNQYDRDEEEDMSAPADPAASETAAAAPESKDQDPLEALRQEKNALQDRMLRTAAEFDNYRKRVDRERRDQADAAMADALEDLLPIMDNLELALSAPGGDEADAYRKGVELIHRQMADLLRKRGVKAIEAVGTDFDPRVHQAVVHEVSPDHREGEVMQELRRGYTLGDRLLRPAMVKVAKA